MRIFFNIENEMKIIGDNTNLNEYFAIEGFFEHKIDLTHIYTPNHWFKLELIALSAADIQKLNLSQITHLKLTNIEPFALSYLELPKNIEVKLNLNTEAKEFILAKLYSGSGASDESNNKKIISNDEPAATRKTETEKALAQKVLTSTEEMQRRLSEKTKDRDVYNYTMWGHATDLRNELKKEFSKNNIGASSVYLKGSKIETKRRRKEAPQNQQESSHSHRRG